VILPVEKFGIKIMSLGKISIDLAIGKSGDAGVPLMISASDSEAGRIFQDIEEKVFSVTQ